MVAMLLTAQRGWTAPVAAAVSGTVRDVHGTPQMGALVELLRADATTVASAMSDDHGRYILPAVVPGKYELRATAAFFVPALRDNIRLQAGAQAIVNLTMSAIFEADNWLPAQRRRADEPTDDWKWALRSTANRPLLRLVDPEDGVAVSSSGEGKQRAENQGRVMVMQGDGAFGDGGTHQALLLNRSVGDGDGAVLRADVGDPDSLYKFAPSVALSGGYERRTPFGGSTRLVSSFQSHPELTHGAITGFQPANGTTGGFAVLQVASTEQIAFGDAVLIDAGTLLAAERLEQTRIDAQPYVHLSARPSDNVVVEYRYATGRELQSAEDLDRLKPTVTVLTDAQGRPLSTRGSHQEISVSRKLGDRVLTVSAFSDRFAHSGIGGSGLISPAGLQGSTIVADPTTGTFQIATSGYSGRGVGVTLMQPLTPALSLWVDYAAGKALVSDGSSFATSELAQSVSARMTQAASVALRGRIARTGTALKAEYRWQPERSLTAVNAYNTGADEAYMSFYLRQRLWCGRLLPEGLDAVVEATNLLEQGYQPMIGPDGRTLFLAQVPRAIQGGLAFNF